MEMRRGDIYWTDLPDPAGSGPGFRRPVLIIQSDLINQSRIATVVALMFTSNVKYKSHPNCVLLRSDETGLPSDSILNCTQIYTLDKSFLVENAGVVEDSLMAVIGEKLRLVLDL